MSRSRIPPISRPSKYPKNHPPPKTPVLGGCFSGQKSSKMALKSPPRAKNLKKTESPLAFSVLSRAQGKGALSLIDPFSASCRQQKIISGGVLSDFRR